MLKEWLRGSSSQGTEEQEAPKKASSRMVVTAENPLNEAELIDERRRASAEKKIADIVEKGPTGPRKMVAYDTFFQMCEELLLEDHTNECQEGIQIRMSRHAQNAMITSKWLFGKPNTSDWEVNLQMNGFTDIISASWSTSNRYQLMYQNVSPLGSLFVAQAFAQMKGPATQGSMFTMFQYPWRFGGCSQVQYLKGQRFSLSHMQRLVRGLYFGSNLTITPTAPSMNADLSHVLSFSTPKRETVFVGEIHPMSGTWRLAALGKSWATNTRGLVELNYQENEEGQKGSALKLALQRFFVGGASLTTSLINFNSVNVDAQIPFGGEMRNVNQFKMQLKCKYDLGSGGMKHGLVFTC